MPIAYQACSLTIRLYNGTYCRWSVYSTQPSCVLCMLLAIASLFTRHSLYNRIGCVSQGVTGIKSIP